MLEEPIGDKPNASTTEEEHIEWLRQETTYLQVEWLMCNCMNSDLSNQFEDLRANEIVDELKNRFIAQVRIARFENLNEFLSLKMEENTNLKQHLRKMHEIHHRLVLVWDYLMTDEFAIDRVLR